MNALTPVPTFPANPKVGQVYYNWVWNGSVWVCQTAGSPVALLRVFTTSQIYWPSPGLTYAQVECMGGGGGGGGAIATFTGAATPGWIAGGGGGGSGGYSRSIIQAALVVNGMPITIGAGGAAGTPPGTPRAANGTATSFGSLVIANGGIGAYSFENGVSWGYSGSGGAAGTGDLAVSGNAGGIGQGTYWDPSVAGTAVSGGLGGIGFFGGVQIQVAVLGGSTIAGTGYPGMMGSGGTGGCSGLNTVIALGGVGGNGLVVVTEYCFGNTALVQDCNSPCPPSSWWTPSW